MAGAAALAGGKAGRGQQPLAGALELAPLQASRCQWLLPLAGYCPCGLATARRAHRRRLVGCCPYGRPPLAGWPWRVLAMGGRPCMGAGCGWSPLLHAAFAAKHNKNVEIVYPCIPDPDGEDEGGQASSSLAVSTLWISTTKLLQSDLATLAKREGGE
ncbi:hypothetical protein BHM03_00014016 [Ensete ventricosum]|nr:hypothetical protein BHM03_00014016 [Ensete ventricosum]